MAYLEIKDFNFRTRSAASKTINLKIDKYDKILLVGNNGSGKSTLLNFLHYGKKIFTTLEGRKLNEVNGSVKFNGRFLDSGLFPFVSYFSQENIFYENSSLRDEFESVASSENVAFNEKDFLDILNTFELSRKITINEKVSNLSEGEKRIVLLTSFLFKASFKDILVLDEPTNHISLKNITILCSKLSSISFINKTILIVSHYNIFPFVSKYFSLDSNTFLKGLNPHSLTDFLI
jgi:ATPase subunit of ABC transporter with duplicated ATPase domains